MAPVVSPRGGALTVDAWYTLFRPTAAGRRALESIRERAWTEPLLRAGVPPAAAGRAWRELVDEARAVESRGLAFPISEQVAWIRRRLQRRVPESAVVSWIEESLDTVELVVTPGALESLRQLRRSGLRVAIVSNVLFETGKAMRRLLARTGLSAATDTIVLSPEVRASKPSPRPIQMALRELGVDPEDALHVGDESSDVEAAWAAGASAARFVGLARHWPPVHSPRIDPRIAGAPEVRSFAAVVAHFERLRDEGHPPLRSTR